MQLSLYFYLHDLILLLVFSVDVCIMFDRISAFIFILSFTFIYKLDQGALISKCTLLLRSTTS